MSVIFKFDFQKENNYVFLKYLNYTKKTQFCMWHFSYNKGKQEQAMDPFLTP